MPWGDRRANRRGRGARVGRVRHDRVEIPDARVFSGARGVPQELLDAMKQAPRQVEGAREANYEELVK